MSERKFIDNIGPFKLSIIAELLGCNLPDIFKNVIIKDVKSLSSATEDSISFLENKKYSSAYQATKARVCIVSLDFEEKNTSGTILLKTDKPYYSYSIILDLFYKSSKKYPNKIENSAHIAETAKIGDNCYIGHNVVIEQDVEIGNNSIVESGSIIDFKVKIGHRAHIGSNVNISHAIIGNDFKLLSGAVIGSDGFGFATNKGMHKKIFHIGRVIIGNDVEIGVNSTIDRGSMQDTIIEDLCRIDNLVQIGHNAHIKKGTILVAQVGIAGSSVIGSYCALGGQVGVAGHITITDNVQIAGQGGVIQNIKEPGIMGGTPAVPIRDWHKQTIILKNLLKGKK